MMMTGNWVLHYSWGATSVYGQTPLTFNADGTFGGSYSGKWRKQSGTVMLSFDGGPAKYGGTVNGNVGSGAMSTFAGLDGCWYLSMQGTSGFLPEGALVEEVALPAGPDGSSRSVAEPKPELVGTTTGRKARNGKSNGGTK
ncbi:MAG TPA: hypothetical protein VGD71_13175 [Kribbella sp.]|jgi:hypothetical protein